MQTWLSHLSPHRVRQPFAQAAETLPAMRARSSSRSKRETLPCDHAEARPLPDVKPGAVLITNLQNLRDEKLKFERPKDGTGTTQTATPIGRPSLAGFNI